MRLAVDALAAFRLTRLVTADAITEPLRVRLVHAAFAAAGKHLDHEPAVEPVADALARWEDRHGDPPPLATLVTCQWCAGIWVAAGVAIMRRIMPRAWGLTAELLACAAAAGLLHRPD